MDMGLHKHGGNNLQMAEACDTWRQPLASQEEQPAASSSEGPQLPFWLLAKTTHGTWQSLPLTAWSRVSRKANSKEVLAITCTTAVWDTVCRCNASRYQSPQICFI